MKQLCGDSVGEALKAVGRWPMARKPIPADFTEEERFRMFRHVLHEHVWPVADIVGCEGRTTFAWSYSVWVWRSNGKAQFVSRVREAAKAEVAEVDYTVYDLRPFLCLIGDDGPRFCRLLKAEDTARMEQRLNGMEADLAVLDRKLDRFKRNRESFGELRYRIDLYDNSYEAVIRGGKGGWLWTLMAP